MSNMMSMMSSTMSMISSMMSSMMSLMCMMIMMSMITMGVLCSVASACIARARSICTLSLHARAIMLMYMHMHMHMHMLVVPSLSTGYKALLLNWGWTCVRWSRGTPGCTRTRTKGTRVPRSAPRSLYSMPLSQPRA